MLPGAPGSRSSRYASRTRRIASHTAANPRCVARSATLNWRASSSLARSASSVSCPQSVGIKTRLSPWSFKPEKLADSLIIDKMPAKCRREHSVANNNVGENREPRAP